MKYPTALLLLIALLLAACGQKGPLFLPGEAPAGQDTATTLATTPAEDPPATDDKAAQQP